MKTIFLVTLSTVTTFFAITQSQKPQPAKVSVQDPAASANHGKAVYQKECLSCHQADGGGVPHLNPPLYESTNVVGDKKKIIAIVLKGM
ncbi:MAG: c-type cytochrome, partial [Pedobacter sp.]|nr:c-type cytochrome [Chitinophagaceae bacterium]